MAKALLLVPYSDKQPDLRLLEGETRAYESGTVNRDINHTFYQADNSIPVGYDSILKATELFNNADPPISTGWKVEAMKNETVGRRFGGHTMIAPARASLPLALVRINSTQAMLDTLNTRLRALAPTGIYGRIPLSATIIVRDTVAERLDSMAALSKFDSRPLIRAVIEYAATTTGLIDVENWWPEFRAVLKTLFQLPSANVIEHMQIGEPVL